ncbi:integration host factor subunit alpha [Acidithiobacillus sp.]|uniref:integration host factor subunit alpha n=1 Tax=Acidithiobacillus sp. TaxID=1872118 RepID=UPI003D016862
MTVRAQKGRRQQHDHHQKELTDNLVDHIGLTHRESKALVESFFNQIRNALAADEEVKLSGFGNFTLRNVSPGRNPKTGETIPITARRVVTFRAGRGIRKAASDLAAEGEQG